MYIKPILRIIYNSSILATQSKPTLGEEAAAPGGGGGGGGGGSGVENNEKRPAATRSSLAPLANINESKRCRGAAAQGSSTHRRLCSAPRVLARVSIRREAAAGGFPESLQALLCSPCIGRDKKLR